MIDNLTSLEKWLMFIKMDRKEARQVLSQGSRQAKLEMAKLMLQRDYPSTEICMMTGLSQAEVEALDNS